ncbi:MAG: hypothetical protein H0U52_05315 [Chloroflexi bacterium]|nr:hypothetical protein [Chloroflexota bacterium]
MTIVVFVLALAAMRHVLFRALLAGRVAIRTVAILFGLLWAAFPFAVEVSDGGPVNWLAATISAVALFVGVAGAVLVRSKGLTAP